MFYVYIFQNKINNKVYIGKTNNVERRTIEHLSKSRSDVNQHFYNAIRKYGIENFTTKILYECEIEAEAYQWEGYFISFYQANNKEFGYNSTSGGEGLQNASEETKKKMSEAAKLRIGQLNGFYGKQHSLETKQKVSKANKGKQTFLNRQHSEETKEKISKANRGKRASPENEFKPGDIPQSAKINLVQAKEIRKKFADGVLRKELQIQYRLSKSQICKIINNQSFPENK